MLWLLALDKRRERDLHQQRVKERRQVVMLLRIVTLQEPVRLVKRCELRIRQTGLDGSCHMTAPELGESGDERVRGFRDDWGRTTLIAKCDSQVRWLGDMAEVDVERVEGAPYELKVASLRLVRRAGNRPHDAQLA